MILYGFIVLAIFDEPVMNMASDPWDFSSALNQIKTAM